MHTRFLSVAALLIMGAAAAFCGEPVTLNRVDPPNWWIGMNDPDVQLMVHGTNIGRTTPRVSIPGVTLRDTKHVESPNYLFLTLSVSAEAKAGTYPVEFMQDSTVAARYEFTLSVREKNSAHRASYDASDVVYLIMSDRFANGSTANDTSPAMSERVDRTNPNGRHGGDIKGISDHLDYLQDLGVTALWNTPLMEDNMDRGSYHHYAITDYYRIDPRFGTNEDYRSLAQELHKRKMKLIMDVVTNHCGLKYYWMKDLPTADWIHQFTEYTPSNKRISVSYDPYASAYDRNENLNGWFDRGMPDLNQDNPLVLKFLVQNTVWWIEYAGLDGLRIDTYPYNSLQKIADWSRAIRREYPKMNIAGECWVGTVQETAYWQTGVKNFDGYDSQLPTVMDFPLQGALASAFNDNNGVNRLYNHFTLDYLYADPHHILTFTENHDLPRFNASIDLDMRKFKLAYTLLLTARGIPQLYYGSEVMMTGDKGKGDGDIRRDFPGGWPGDEHTAFTREGRTAVENEAHDFMKRMLDWRKKTPVIASGKTMQFIPHRNCYVYFRYDAETTVMVLINDNDTEARTVDTKRFAEILHGFSSGYDVVAERTITDLTRITVDAKTSMVIELKK